MKFLVLGAYDSSNLGDPVICDCVALWLRGHFPQAQVIVKDVLPRRDGSAPDLKSARRRWRRNRLIRAMTRFPGVDLVYRQYRRWVDADQAYIEQVSAVDCDAVVFAGGQLFMDRYALYLSAYTERFEKRGIPVFFNACGIGPACSPGIAGRLTTALNSPCVKYVSCRDDVGLVNSRYTSAHAAQETFDPAISTEECYGVHRNSDADTIGLGVIYNQAVSEPQQTRFWQGLVRELERRGLKWQFFTNGDPLDYAYACALLNSMPELETKASECLHSRDRKPEELVRTIAGYRSLISFRLHSHIIAASLGVPGVAVVWDEKCPFFFRKIGHEERCFSVKSHAVAVLSALEQAEREGYDRVLLKNQAEFARTRLIEAIDREVSLRHG